MNTAETQTQIIKYETKGTCCRVMQVELIGETIQNVEFYGGCEGNIKGLKVLLAGMHIDEVIAKFSGIPCDGKPTSCPDQLAVCLKEYKAKK